ncbi:PorT family protein [Antarcticibacterium sp. 1MA-6-2]|uniref:porin family protein n=1 Tax=Antarcticibacterium sp. 1MA-6-2 TaxID=2908210 RepID=UPI001F3A10DF|nr:porin family protein [Antarcticibacterium sp. 1MA-6-2]UJH90509.1 PorT family protein [Antarcticibacterium sp. 1MA-6-2]
MKNLFLFLVGNLVSISAIAQETIIAPTVIDSAYREDQIYVGLTFHLLTDLPGEVTQKAFSGGFHLGFIRDFPINQRRNIALGAGLGWSINTYGHELFIGEDEEGKTIFRDLNARDIEYDTNRLSTHLIEVPIEFRWRTSTPETYKFWRVYAGVRLGYAYFLKTNFKQDGNQVMQKEVPEFQRFRIGSTLTFGYNTFNFHVYYSLNPFFQDAALNQSEIGMSTLKLGLMFYIL